MAGYVYGGDMPIKPRKVPKPHKPGFDPELCGSIKGHSQHRRHDEDPCRKCMDAYNRRRNEQRAAARQQ